MDAPTSRSDRYGPVAAAAFEQGVEPKLVVELDGTVLHANAVARRSLDGVCVSAEPEEWCADAPETLRAHLRDAAGSATPMPFTLQVHSNGRVQRRPCWLCRIHTDGPGLVMVQFREMAIAGANFRRLTEDLQASVAALARERQVRQDLEAAFDSVDRFAAVAAHDLRAPLHHMASYVALLRRALGDQLDAQHLQWIEHVETSAVRLGGMINDLLEHARTGRREAELVPVDLDALVTEVLDDLQEALDGATVARDPLPTLLGDRTLLRVILQNLLQNAMKYRHPHRPLQVAVRVEQGDDGSTAISVCDNGIGFAAAEAEGIFQPFQRASNVGGVSGSGIGLATCRQAAQKVGWQLTASGEPDMGATFRLVAPANARLERG